MERRVLTPEDRFRLEAIGDPQISPDGRLAVYVSQLADLEANKNRTALKLVDLTTGRVRSLTAGLGDRHPRWSPDGKLLAFVSERSGKAQLHIIDPTGGEARAIATEQTPDSAPVWSPDGAWLAFTAQVEEKPAGLRYKGAPAQETDGVKVIDKLDYHFDGKGFYGDQVSHVFVVAAALSGEKARRLTTGAYNHGEPAWSPDGRTLAVVARRVDHDEFDGFADLYLLDVASGELKLLASPDGALHNPAWSADGRTIACTGVGRHAPRGVANTELWLVDVATSAIRSLTKQHDRPLGVQAPSDVRYGNGSPFRWAPDGTAFYCLFSNRGQSSIYRVPLDGSETMAVDGIGWPAVAGFDIAADGTLLYTAGSMARCDQLFVLPPGGKERKLTNVNADVLEGATSMVERFSYEGVDGLPMDGWIVFPTGARAGQKYPTILSVHGGPTGAYGDALMFQFHLWASQGYAVVYTNPRGSQTYGEAFAAGCIADWGGKDYQDIMLGLDKAIAMGVVDPERVGITGWSYGGYMSCWAITQTGRFKAAVAGANITNLVSLYGTSDIGVTYDERLLGGPLYENYQLYLERSAIMHVANVTTPVLLLHGENDIRCPVEQSEQFFTSLRRLGRTAVFIRYPGEYHGLTRPAHVLDRFRRTLTWFDEFVKA